MKQLCKYERIVALLTLALLLAGFGSTHPAYAATINVTTFADNLTDNGDCSLREAIQAANTNTAVDVCPAGSDADTIQLSAGTYNLSLGNITGDEDQNKTGDLDINDIGGNLTIRGVDASTTSITNIVALDRVMHILPNTTVTLSGVSINNGHSSQNGGAVFNKGTLILHSVVIQNSSADGNGGGLFNDAGTVTIHDGTINNNQSQHGGGIYNNNGTVTLDTCIVNNDQASAAGHGGGIYNSNNATLIIENCWIHDNTANGQHGGGIYNLGTASINNSFIHNSHASENGGNIYSGDNGLSSLTISNTTISRGLAGANGGGLFNDGALTLTNVTIAENSAASGGGIYNAEHTQKPVMLTNITIASNTNAPASAGAGIFNVGTSLTLKNTLVAVNGTLGNCAGVGSISSAGNNLTSDGTCSFTAPGDLSNKNPLLGPLQDNGGVIFAYGGAAPSYALLPGSPALNAGTNVDCPAIDQRGWARPHGIFCDIGSFEANDAPRTVADSYSINEDTPLLVGAPGLLANDSDLDNDVIIATLLTTPAHGALTLNQNGAFSYTPTLNYHGQDSFSYQISDGSLSSASTLVTLTVISVNDPPIAANDTASTPIDTVLSIPVATLLSNDTDIEGDSLTVSDVRGNSARGGQVMRIGSSVVYTPPAHFSGVDSLIYTLSDGNGGTDSGTVTVIVGAQHIYLPMARR
ncbi:MAG: tandem-95 repeat protein [Roseiflexaceae bacterium]